MKAIKINSEVKLKSGLVIPSGSVVLISEAYADIKNFKDNKIPCQLVVSVFASYEDYIAGKSKITDVADFEVSFKDLNLIASDYETLATQTMLIGILTNKLNEIYPDKIEVININ